MDTKHGNLDHSVDAIGSAVDGVYLQSLGTATSTAAAVTQTPPGVVALSLADASAAALSAIKTGPLAVLDTQLAALYYAHSTQATQMSAFTGSVQQIASALTSDGKYVLIDTTAKDGNGAALLSELKALGLKGGSSFGAVASGWLPTSAVAQLTTAHNLGFARESAFQSNAGFVTSQADSAEHADTARSSYSVTGAGLRVGVLSDSFDTSTSTNPVNGGSDTAATNIASGDLPTDTRILADSADGTDEGRGMAQLIHDIAPGAAIDFATAYSGQAGFANNILALAAAGDKVIVDDVSYFAELTYQNGVIGQAVNQVAAQGVSYFTSAGNDGIAGYEGAWQSGGTETLNGQSYQVMQFAPGQNYILVTDPASSIFILQWDQPGASAGGVGSASDLDIYLTDGHGNIITGSAANNINGDPVEVFAAPANATGTYQLHVGLLSGPAPTEIRLIASGNGRPVSLQSLASNTNNGTLSGHHGADGAIAVGAAAFYDTPAYNSKLTSARAESYTSGGTQKILFDDDGNRLAAAHTNSVAVTAVDGANTTFFYSDTSRDPDAYPNFFGTSAAAPDAAAVAALLLQANSSFTPGDMKALLQDSAQDMNDPATAGFDTGIDGRTGAGLVQADLALQFGTTRTIRNDANAALFGTHLNDHIYGGSLDNSISAREGNDYVEAGDGNDLVHGGSGNDTVYGNAGNDTIYGDDGNDALYGSTGDDILSGGAGDDLLDGGSGNDTLNGGTGINTASYTGAGAGVTVNLDAGSAGGAAGSDTLYNIQNVVGGSYADTITGDAQDNVLSGGAGSDELHGGDGNDTLDGGAGAETQYRDTANRPDVTKPAAQAHDTPATALVLKTAAGGDFDLVASNDIGAAQTIPHATVLASGNGTVDYYAVTAAAGAHAIFDIDHNLLNDAGGDTLDTVITLVDAAGNVLAVNDDSYSDAGSELYGSLIDYTFANAGTYYLRVEQYGDPGIPTGATYTLNVSLSSAGVTSLGTTSPGHDVLDGGAGSDTASYASATAAVTVSLLLQDQVQATGGAGSDYLHSIENLSGSTFNDTLTGDGSANILTGGGGADTLTGGAGADVFRYLVASDSTVSAQDIITDFATGSDKIDLRALHTSNSDSFTITSSGNATLVNVDLGGNGSIDLRIHVNGANAVATSDVLWTTTSATHAVTASSLSDDASFHGHALASSPAHVADHLMAA